MHVVETDAREGMGVREDLQSSQTERIRHREPTDTSNELAMRE